MSFSAGVGRWRGSQYFEAGALVPPDDPHQWLEEVEGAKALAWVRERNGECIAAVGDPVETESYKRILAILDSKDKIPHAFRIGTDPSAPYYNFWQVMRPPVPAASPACCHPCDPPSLLLTYVALTSA